MVRFARWPLSTGSIPRGPGNGHAVGGARLEPFRMTQKLCFIGNSHLAALKRGWDGMAADYPDVDITMFIGLGHRYEHAYLEGHFIKTQFGELLDTFVRHSGGRDSIDLTAYDRFVVVGLGFDIVLLTRIYDRYRTVMNNGPAKKEVPFVSLDVLAQMVIADLREHSLALRLASMVKTVVSDPVHLCWVPLKRKAALRISTKKKLAIAKGLAAIRRNGDEDLVRVVMERIRVLLRPEGILLIEQPEETVADRIFTREELSQAAHIGPDDPHIRERLDDIGHMNPFFGRIMMNRIMETVAPGARVATAAAIDSAAEIEAARAQMEVQSEKRRQAPRSKQASATPRRRPWHRPLVKWGKRILGAGRKKKGES
ncbi:hypothetical protein L2U69_18940 [Zavarzinia compransoris]|uniref:hypothetical protein n=1 Tax=Zavarzinia marina TaxID=2911065 RepID=UPI001F3B7C2F|nr:hypothetical protein [Zavarzinia marina]MCF4167729.1 hypothetical protein [Zavarzinia marina]